MGGARPKHGSPQHFPSRSREISLALAVSLALLATACSPGPPATQHTSSTATRPADTGPVTAAGTPRETVIDLCSRFTVAALSSNATIDQGPAQARRRAAQEFGTPELINLLGGEGRDQTWPTLVQHQAHVRVETTPVDDDPPPARGNQAGAGVIATRVAIGADGWRQDLASTIAYCSLVGTGDGWKVAGVTFSDTIGSGQPQ